MNCVILFMKEKPVALPIDYKLLMSTLFINYKRIYSRNSMRLNPDVVLGSINSCSELAVSLCSDAFSIKFQTAMCKGRQNASSMQSVVCLKKAVFI